MTHATRLPSIHQIDLIGGLVAIIVVEQKLDKKSFLKAKYN